MVVLHFLAEPKWCGWNASLSKACSAEAAMLNNFFWNEVWTFRCCSEDSCRRTRWLTRLVRFQAICGLGILFAVLLLSLFYKRLHFNLYAANLLAILLVTLWNFWMNALLTWTSKVKKEGVNPVKNYWEQLNY